MRKNLTFLFCMLLSMQMAWCQFPLLIDSFEDGDISDWIQAPNGHWTAGTTTPITGSYSLKHDRSSVQDTSHIVRQLTFDPSSGTTTWEWQWRNGNWGPSGNNKWWFYLLSDQQDISQSGTQNGYAVGVNMNVFNDQVTLYKVTNGTHNADLIQAGPAFTISGGELYSIRVTKTAAGNWQMWIDGDGGFDNLISVGTATDASYNPVNPWCGLMFQYSFSRAGELWLDDLNIETTTPVTPDISLEITDTVVREGTRTQITVNASSPVNANKTFTLNSSGQAISGFDYAALPATITLPALTSSATIQLHTLADPDFESTETIQLTLGTNGQTNVNLTDSTVSLDILDYVRVMDYNLLRYPSATDYATKNFHLKKILDYLQPDILGVNELDRTNGSNNADSLLYGALNINGVTKYARAVHENNTFSPISNMLFYNTDKFALASQEELIIPNERNPNIYHLYYTYPSLGTGQDTIWLHVIQSHLKAGTATGDSLQRATSADSIMAFMDRQGPGNWLLMGDFNVYTSDEVAYQEFIDHPANLPVQFYDPINTPGDWNSNPAFAEVHTQSTRTVSEPDGGASGGMDDRFDFILPTSNILNGTDSVQYLPGTYEAVGQDGNRYNQSLIGTTNATVPDSIANALYAFSDHLPVIAGFQFTYPGQLLPANTLTFRAAQQQGQVQLTWQLEAPVANGWVEIESSENDREFQHIGITPEGEGIAQFLDPEPLSPGQSRLYRLKLTDPNGGSSYSEIATVTRPDLIGFQVAPNPASDHLMLKTGSQDWQWRMVDLRGQEIKKGKETSNAVRLSLAGIPDGLYLIQLDNGQERAFRRLIIRRK